MPLLSSITDGNWQLGQGMQSVVVLDQNHQEIDLGINFVSFETDPVNEDISINVISEGGKKKTQVVEQGYTLALNFAKSGPEHDDFQHRLQEHQRINKTSEKFTVQTSERFANGIIRSWQYQRCSIRQTKGGRHELNQAVTIDYNIIAEDRQPM